MLITTVQPTKYKVSKELIDEVFSADPARRIYLCKNNHALFFIYYFRHYIKYPFADFHWDMFQDLNELRERKISELGWIAHRESVKTSFVKSHIVRRICYEEKRFINVDCYDGDNSEQILFDVANELQTNELIIQDFGQLYNEERFAAFKTKKRIKDFITANKIRVAAYSTQQAVRGRTYGENRPDELILDDFETYSTIKSQAAQKQVEDHMNEFYGGLAPDHSIIYLANYISEFGNVQKLIDRAKTSDSLKIRMVPVAEEWMGKIYWPTKYVWTIKEAKELNAFRNPERPLVALEQKKEQMGDSFWGDMMNMPMKSEHQEFTRDMFKYISMEEVNKKVTLCRVIFDPAGSKNKEADFTGVTIFWIDQDGRRYLKSYQVKFDSKEILNHIFHIHDTYKPEKFYIEEGMYMLVIKPFLDDEMRKRNKWISIETVKHNQTSKETRIRGLIPGLTSNSVYFIQGQCKDLEDQLLRFPNGKHDDVADSAAYTMTITDKPYDGEEYDYEYEKKRYPDINVR